MSAEDEIRAKLKGIAAMIQSQLPEGFGFSLLVNMIGQEGVMLYVANLQRTDVLQVMREFIAVNMEQRNWQRERTEIEATGGIELNEEFDAWWEAQMQRMPNYSGNKKVKEMARDAFNAGRSTA